MNDGGNSHHSLLALSFFWNCSLQVILLESFVNHHGPSLQLVKFLLQVLVCCHDPLLGVVLNLLHLLHLTLLVASAGTFDHAFRLLLELLSQTLRQVNLELLLHLCQRAVGLD